MTRSETTIQRDLGRVGRRPGRRRTDRPGFGGFRLRLLAVLLGLGASTSVAAGEGIEWSSSFETALEQARAEQKFVMVDFFTSWCGWCKVLDRKTYTDSVVVALSKRMVSVKVDAEARKDLAKAYGVRAYPTILFLNPDGTVRQGIRGFQPPERFAPAMIQILGTDSERYALSQQVRDNPGDTGLRRSYADVLARSGAFGEAAAQIDTVLRSGDLPEERLGLELDRLIYLHRSGTEAKKVRKGLESWVRKAKGHPRLLEGKFYQARAEEAEGRSKQARKLYGEIVKESPGSWFAEVARGKLGEG